MNRALLHEGDVRKSLSRALLKKRNALLHEG